MAKVTVDKDKCIGCGACTATCPEIFEFDDDGLAKVVKDEINDDVKMVKDEINDDVKMAAEGCPTEAIEVKEEN